MNSGGNRILWVRGTYAVLVGLLLAHLLFNVWRRDGFTWMDPFQYYTAAAQIAAGQDGMAGFPVASSYPFLLGQWLKIDSSMPFALASNGIWLLVLACAVWQLARHWRVPGLAPLLLLAALAAPALFGLSRELYLEFPLAALVALHYAVWFQRGRLESARWYWPLFGALMALGFSVKMTYPVFLVGPLAAEGLRAVRAKAWRRAGILALGFCAPIALVAALAYVFWPSSFAYYLSLGNTTIPPMRLIGPPESFSLAALLFYPGQLFQNYLFLLCPAAVVFVWFAAPAKPAAPETRDRLDLWLWLLVPLAAFSLEPVREPRHVAPCFLPLLLLTLLGVAAVRKVGLRRLVWAALALAAGLQYAALATHRLLAPYLLDRPMKTEAILMALFRTTPNLASFMSAPGQVDVDRWRYSRSTLLSGFPPNEALALVWTLNPGVALDLDAFGDPQRRLLPHGYLEYADLYLLGAFNVYNQRCGWPGYYETLGRERALAAADALLVAVHQGTAAPPLSAGFRRVATVDQGAGWQVAVCVPEKPPEKSFRRLYAEEFLRRRPDAPKAELNAVYQSLLLDAAMRGRRPAAGEFRSLFPAGFVPGAETKEICFLPIYRDLRARLQAMLAANPTWLGPL